MPTIKYDNFKDLCQGKGLKATTQRFIIYKTLTATTEHPTADHLFDMVSKNLPALSRDTVYRTLNVLAECGMVSKLVMPGGATHFDGDISQHCHFLCDKCGRIMDLFWPEFAELPCPEEAYKLGHPHQAVVLIIGTCLRCFEMRQLPLPIN